MAKARKLPSGTWRCQVYSHTENGKRIYKSFSASTKKEAEYMAAEYAMDKGKKKDEISNMTFSEALNTYIEKRATVLSPATIREYERLKNKNFKLLNEIKLSDISQDFIQEQINIDALTLSAKSVRNMHGLISVVLKVYRPGFILNTALPAKTRPEIYVPTDAEIKKLLKTIENTPLEIPVLLAVFGPLRRGEICALHTDDIKGNVIHIKHSMVLDKDKQWQIKSPKTYSSDRLIDLPNAVIAKIRGKTGYIVGLTPDSISSRFRHALNHAGLKHFRFHDLRHYHASISHALGIPDQYIMARGGWSSDRVLKTVYRHTMSDKLSQMTEKANTHFNNILE